jgi:hypothetical protein
MANHVDNYIQVQGSAEAEAEFERIFGGLIADDKSLFDAEFLPRNEDGKVDIDSVGAKWAFVEDAADDYACVTSAWSAVLPFVELLGDHLLEIDEKVRITCQFTDEGYNFVGSALYHDGYIIADEEYYEDLVEARMSYLSANGEEVPEDSDEYDPWEDDGWHDFVNDRVHAIEVDLMESCEEPVMSYCASIA